MKQLNNEKNYSVVIRTLGTGGDKYKSLLDSVLKQTIKPQEIIVVLPVGYELDYQIGLEKVIYSQKGMVIQRVVGINNADADYILVVDDDVCFDENFVANAFKCIQETNADAIQPKEINDSIKSKLPELDFKSKLKTKIENLKFAFLGQRFYHKDPNYRIKIAPTGGHSLNIDIDSDKYYLCQSGNFQCFFINTEKAKKVNFEEERWLEETNYALFDDQVFFYKSYLLGCKIVYAPQIEYTHLDGGIGQHQSFGVEKIKKSLYGSTRNKAIFWHRFLFLPAKMPRKCWLIICYAYGLINTLLIYSVVYSLRPSCWGVIKSITKGFRDGFRFCRSDQYKNLTPMK